jgi:hypothetical protein
MRQVRETMRLRQAGASTRQIDIRVGVAAASTVRLTLRRVAACGLPVEQADVTNRATELPSAASTERLTETDPSTHVGHGNASG